MNLLIFERRSDLEGRGGGQQLAPAFDSQAPATMSQHVVRTENIGEKA